MEWYIGQHQTLVRASVTYNRGRPSTSEAFQYSSETAHVATREGQKDLITQAA